ncbi:MAG: GFA family protein [Rhodospirillales bacterium]|nr:GFA family protein [Rhodospirillales bacterium]
MAASITGGCLCGRIRYQSTAAPRLVTHCHCTICRRQSGAAFLTWASFQAAALTITQGTPTGIRATEKAERSFCAECGTPMTFRFFASPDEIDVTIGSLDDPTAVTPQDHIWTSTQLHWLAFSDGLPSYPERRGSRG